MKKHLRHRWMALALVFAMLTGTISIPSYAASGSRFAGEEWYDQIETVEINREPAHASFIPYETAVKALANEKSVLDEADEMDSAYYQSLNGTWDFYYSENPDSRLKNRFGSAAADYTENWNTAGWDTIEVPSNIQTQRNADGSFKYDKPIYVNQRYPWANYETVDYNNGRPSAPTVVNGVGHYKRTFTLPDSWNGRQVFVSFQGVESAFYVYVNGKRVGYGEDSYTPDDFNITPYLKAGENTIAVEVYRWSTGSYLENQDFIRLSGIFRDVYLYSKDKVELRDIFVTTDLNNDYSQATVNLSVDVKNLAGTSGNYTVEAQLYDADDNEVWSKPVSTTVRVSSPKSTVAALADDTGVTAKVSGTVKEPKLWYADNPYLYRLLVQLKDGRGNVLENACIRVGMREVGTASVNSSGQQQIQINGKKIMLRGTNRQEIDAENGRAISRETILHDVQMMKSFNVNAIRTSHYPNNTYLYDLADELGMYVCDEANIESHLGAISSTIPSGSPIWNASVMDRTKNMVERDKNHASVIIWSLGNEATYDTYTMNDNYCFYNSTRWILERDPSRIRKYERDNRYTDGNRATSMVDVYSSQYWSVDYCLSHIKNTNNKLPYIQSEYAHAMGTGLGNLKEYWDLFRTYDNANGGFIWDWIDQALYTTKNGQTYFGYGGDWGETVTDNDFCANGMINADRTPSPEIYEVKKVLQEVSFYDEDINNGKVRIVNEFLDTNLNEFRILWNYAKDNKTIKTGELTANEINIKPGASKTVQLDLPKVDVVEGSDYVLTFSVVRTKDTTWANPYGGKAGDEIAFEQFELNQKATVRQPSMNVNDMADLKETNTDGQITFKGTTEEGQAFEITISKTTGYITKYQVAGKDLLTSGPVPNYWRAATSNDISAGVAGDSSNLKDADKNFKVDSNGITIDRNDKVVTVTIPGQLTNTRSKNTIEYTVYANGVVNITNIFEPSTSCDKIARVGMKMTVPAGMEMVTYYGKGEWENYADRNTGAKLGAYSTTVTDMFEEKRVKPQENGNRTGTRWVSLMDDTSRMGILVSAEDTMEFSTLHYTAEELSAKRHPYELKKLNETILTVDYAQRGLGNASCGPDALPKYQLPTGATYTHTYSIRPITGRSSADADFADVCMEKSNQNMNSSMPISGITVDGVLLENFATGVHEYTYERVYNEDMTAPVVGVVKTSDDVQVSIEQIAENNGTVVITATSPYGTKVTYYVTISTVKREYLSDMDWTKSTNGYFANTRDMCGTNPIQLSVDGKPVTYEKGVGMHAPASVTVNIAGKGYTRFTAVAGINYNQVASNNGNSNVNLVVEVDGKEKFRENNIGYNTSGNVFSVPVDVDVTGANTVKVIAEMGANNYNDHVSWADAKFTAVMGDIDDSYMDRIVAARNIATITTPNTIPSLPGTVNGVFEDGTLVDGISVTWDTMRSSQFATEGKIVIVEGTATLENGKTLPVTASVRVAVETDGEEGNLAPTAELEQDIAADKQSDNLASIINGKTRPGNNANERWTNYNNRTTSDKAALTFTWNETQYISSIDLHYYIDEYSADMPQDVKFEYSTDGKNFRTISASEKMVEQYTLGAQYKYTFSSSRSAKALRITLTQKSNKCVGLTEAEITGYQRGLVYNTNAALSGIRVDGTLLDEFVKDTLEYTAYGTEVKPEWAGNMGVTVLPMYKDVVRILTLSEDGKNERTYAITLTEKQPCEHINTETRGAKNPTCTEAGYTGDVYCTDCGEKIEEGRVIESTGHDIVLQGVKNPTCTEEGYTGDSFCLVCDAIVEQGTSIPVIAHTIELQNVKEVTCTEDGYTGDKVCTMCNEIIGKGISVPHIGHLWDKGVVTKEPTETETGIKTFTCVKCPLTREEVLPVITAPKELKEPEVSLKVTKNAGGQLVLTGKFEDYVHVEDYYEVTAHGLLYYPTVKLGRSPLTINTPGRTRVNFTKYKSDGTFVYNMKPANLNVKYTVRAFMAYVNEQGKTIYIYSDPISASYNSLP